MSRKTRQYGAALKHAVERAGRGAKRSSGVGSKATRIEALRSAAMRMAR